MEKFKLKKAISYKWYALLFAAVYFVSYISRINYGAIISEMETETNISRSLLSVAITGSFVTYGIGQIISGIFGDRASPKKLVSLGLLVTAAMNLLIPLYSNPYYMLVVWCVNGLAQAFMWPPIVKLMAAIYSEEEYKSNSVKVSWGASFGTIAVYLISPAIISLFNWKFVFIFSGVSAIIMMIFWNILCVEPENIITEKENEKSGKKGLGKLFSFTLIGIMFSIILQGMLRDGVTTWMPSFISDTYKIDNLIAILTAVILPIFSIFSYQLASVLYSKIFKNPLVCAGVMFGVAAVSGLCLVVFSNSNAVVSIVFSAILTGMMHGVNVILICMIPPFFKKYGLVSTASGVLNSCTYIGSSVSTYGIALLSENLGWGFTLKIWLLIAVFGTAICFLCAKPWHKKFSN